MILKNENISIDVEAVPTTCWMVQEPELKSNANTQKHKFNFACNPTVINAKLARSNMLNIICNNIAGR
jgi:hypothetical protein